MKVIKTLKGNLLVVGQNSVFIKRKSGEKYWCITYKSGEIDYDIAYKLTEKQADVLLEKLFILIASRDKTLIRISEWLEE